MKFLSLIIAILVATQSVWTASASGQDHTDFPALSYQVVPGFFKLPDHFNFGEVSGVALDQRGHIFIFNRGPQPLVEFTASGKYVRTIGDGLFEGSHGLRIDPHGNLWTTDVTTNVVLRLNREGHVTMVLGRKGRTGETDALFNQPTDVAFGPNGEILVADGYGNSRIVKFDGQGQFIKAWGKKGNGPGEFNLPHTIVVDPRGRVIVGDRDNMRIQLFDLDGNYLAQWTQAGSPWGLELTKDGFLFMADGYANRVVKLDLDGNVLGTFGAAGKTEGLFAFAHSIAVGKQGEIFVAEILNWRVQKFVPIRK
jgi:DNA-binding beta-propeller fold protein YncE